MVLRQNKKTKILGQDVDILYAIGANLLSWFIRTFVPSLLPKLLPAIPQQQADEEEDRDKQAGSNKSQDDVDVDSTTRRRNTKCVVIGRPGGGEQLRLITLKDGIVTCGYNVVFDNNEDSNDQQDDNNENQSSIFTPNLNTAEFPSDCVIISNQAFSVNYADCCIRWGLYESASTYVGYPICPGFDVAGIVESVGSDVKNFKVGDYVFGCSLFGAYSTKVLVPVMQLRKIPTTPSKWTFVQAASIPTVALTSLYALFLAGHYPSQSPGKYFTNKSILIHSAAGGVGGMLIQMSKILGLKPIVGVVGRTDKVETAKQLGCDIVIDKSRDDLWKKAEMASPNGYATIMDASGVNTLQASYEHLAPTGRLIVYGFHTNLPVNQDSLNPFEVMKMGFRMQKMPKFDPMDMGSSNRAVMAFNLSFFSEEREMLTQLFEQVVKWLENGQLNCPQIVEMPMEDIRHAHELIQSGKTVGKIVLTTTTNTSYQ